MPDWQLWAVVAITLLVLWLFVREVVPAALTALLAATLLMLTGILSPEEGLSGFSSEATITVMAVFVLGAGFERTGAVAKAIGGLIAWSRGHPRRQIIALGAVAGPVSGFINNTAVVAVMLPAAMRMARESDRPPSKLLIPLSYLAMLGGTLTIIGTSTNLLGNALLPRFGIDGFPFFGFFFIGLAALLLGWAYFMTVGLWLLPDRGWGGRDPFDLEGFIAEYLVGDDVAGKTLDEAGFVMDKTRVVRVRRRDAVHGAPPAWFRLEAGDQVVLQGSRERLETLSSKGGVHPLQQDPELDQAEDQAATSELVITPGSSLAGKTLESADLRTYHGVVVLAVRHHHRVAVGPLAEIRLAVGDVLLVQGTPDALDALEHARDFVLTRSRGHVIHRTSKIPVAAAIVGAVVALAALQILPIVVAALAGGVAMVLSGCLRLDESLESIRWDIILLLAGIIPLGIAVEKVGLAAAVAGGLVDLGGGLPGLAFLIVLFLVTTIFTEIVSNNASVVLLIPVAIEAAQGVGLDPRPFALTVMLAASTSMLTPIGYQTNTMVYAPGRYRFTDFARVGAPLNLALALLIPFLVTRFYPL